MPKPTDADLNEVAQAALLQAADEGERDEEGNLTPEAQEHVRAVAELCADREALESMWEDGES